jgi:GLPGLI family protein
MLKRFLFISLLFNSIIFIGQIKNGIVEYNLIIGDDKELESGMMADYYKDAKKNAKSLSYSLVFNQSEMIFYQNQYLEKEGDGDTSFSRAFSGVEGKYFKDKDSNVVLNEVDNPIVGHLIIKREISLKWVLIKETKKIDDYICYKANAELIIKNSVGEFKRILTAWYCPDLPFSYGPKGYGGLPGLILEFQEKNIVLGAVKISLNPTTINFDKPNKVKIVTDEELSKIIDNNSPKY